MREEVKSIAKRKVQRVMITMDTRLITACDKYLDKLQEAGVGNIVTKSQLIERALLFYFEELARQNLSLTKGENKDEN